MSAVKPLVARMTFFLVCALCTLGCSAADILVGNYRCSNLTAYFYGDAPKVRLARFAGAELDKQYAIYVCGNQYIEPPATYFATEFAREGHKAVPLLKVRLLEATSDGTIQNIILVFAEMSRQKTYDVVGDKRLMELIQEAGEKVRDSFWKAIVDKEIKEIEASDAPSAATTAQ